MPTINVQATATDRHAVLWERHPSHPEGEAFVAADGRVVAVAVTPRVRELLRTGVLAEVQAPPAPPEPEPEADDVSGEDEDEGSGASDLPPLTEPQGPKGRKAK